MSAIGKIAPKAVSLELIPDVAGSTQLSIKTAYSRLPRAQNEDTFGELTAALAKELCLDPSKVTCKEMDNDVFVQILIQCTPQEIRKVLPQFQEPFLKHQEALAQKSHG